VNIDAIRQPRLRGGRVVALHCSGSGASQWNTLANALGGDFDLRTPEHYGAQSSGPWPGQHAFTLADEAAKPIALIDESQHKVHLVGHSYAGGVALQAALLRPSRIASMALYEPCAFHLLRLMGSRGADGDVEITNLARRFRQGVADGDYRRAVGLFVDYWNGVGAWERMRPAAQDAMVRWAPKGTLEWRASIDNPTTATEYRVLNVPVLILRGEHAPASTRVIADYLSELLPAGQLHVIAGAGHMGPLTHAAEVSALIERHIVGAEANLRSHCRDRRGPAGDIGLAAWLAEAAS